MLPSLRNIGHDEKSHKKEIMYFDLTVQND